MLDRRKSASEVSG